ncbi:MAG: type II toxin-antitoxin system HicB family antitoxin [Candidatus Vogelbacteria bacterium]|nr:type II toxin-antitoxin system HicB family antitoxin [Candidatus Vogelbacteria bacterium]
MVKRNFKIVIEQGADGYFIASVPALPGCYTQAKELGTLRKRVREAIALCLEVAKEDAVYRRRIRGLEVVEPVFIGLDTVEV